MEQADRRRNQETEYRRRVGGVRQPILRQSPITGPGIPMQEILVLV